jgi:signal peptidase
LGGYGQLLSSDSAFVYLGKFMLPAAAIHLLATYLSLRGGPLVSIAYLGVMMSFEWFSPILPDLIWPIAALIGVTVPLLGLSVLDSDGHLDTADEESAGERAGIGGSWIAAVVMLLLVLWFNTGVFGIRPAIVQGTSMLPNMETGDIAITRDVAPEDLQIGDVIRFRQGSHVVLHRIIEISVENGETVFITR